MVIKNSVSNDFLSTLVDSMNVFDCRLSGMRMEGYTVLMENKRAHRIFIDQMIRFIIFTSYDASYLLTTGSVKYK